MVTASSRLVRKNLFNLIYTLFLRAQDTIILYFCSEINRRFEVVMRIDKFLWCVRYFKTRSIATEACKQGKVKIGGTKVKPSREVFPGDELTVRKNQLDYQLEVIDLPPSRVGAKLVNLYVVDKTP